MSLMTEKPSHRPGEFAMIAAIFAPLATSKAALGLKDDAACLTPSPGEDLVVTADALVEGVHFLKTDPPSSIAQKALRVNLSDLAAKGAEPVGYLLTLSLASWIDEAWLRAFARGLEEDQQEFGIALLGGDTTATPGPLTISITAMGRVPTGTMLTRGGARPGDLVFVSGTIGDAGGGLEILQGKLTSNDAFLVGRYHVPTPRLALGRALRGSASASLDVSDGLFADLGHIAEVSGVELVVRLDRIPLSANLSALRGASSEAVLRAASAGDDYEIAFTAPPALRGRVQDAAAASGVPVTEIGEVRAGLGVTVLDRDGNRVAVGKAGFTHF
jgi:thiamine-monophosphate kinase